MECLPNVTGGSGFRRDPGGRSRLAGVQPGMGAGIEGDGDGAGLVSLPGPLDVVAVGFFTGGLGVDQAARNVVTALRRAGLEVAAVEPVILTDRRAVTFATQPPRRAAVSIICANPPELPVLARAPLVPASDRRIGLWFWELDEIPETWVRSAEAFDEVWVTSRLALEALSLRTSVPVRLVPLPIGLPGPHCRDPAPIPKSGVRLVVDDPTEARKRAERAAVDVAARYRPEVAGLKLVEALNEVAARPRRRTRPRISVVLPVSQPWPSARDAFDGIRSQVERVGGELVVVDGHGDGLAEEQAGGVVLLREPGADVFQLRNLGVDVADGSIVAITEGHCVPDEHWVEGMLTTHSSQSSADGVVGAVRNGTSSTLADRANFLATFAPFTHPLTTLPPNRVPPVASLSFRRETLAAPRRPGDLELVLLPGLSVSGRLDPGDGVVVEHHQSHGGLARTVAVHYHNGRAIGGHARGTLSRAGLQARLHWCIRFPRTIVTETRAALVERGVEPRALELVVVSGLGAAHAIGHLIGWCFGPGSSAQRLH